MKVVFMTSGTIKSSISYRPLSIAKRLVKKGHEVYIFSPRFDKYSNFIDEEITEIEGVTIIRPIQFLHTPFIFGLIPYVLSSIVILLKINPDIIHIFKPNPITVSSYILKIFKKTPIIFDTDDLDTEVMKIEKNPKLLIWMVYLSEIIASKYSSAITCVSKYLLNKYSKKNKTVYFVPNGADFNLILQDNSLSKMQRKVIFIGNINRINILEPFFLAFKKLIKKNKTIKGVIIGDGKYLNYFKNLVKETHLDKNISFLGYIPQENLKNHVSIGDLGYCYMPDEPTTRACSSMKVFQYLQLGIVPIVSNVGDLPEYIFNGKSGYIIKNNSIDELANIIQFAIDREKVTNNKNMFNLANSKKKYSWDTLATQIEKIYKEVYETRYR